MSEFTEDTINAIVDEVPVLGVSTEAAEAVTAGAIWLLGDATTAWLEENTPVDELVDFADSLGVMDESWDEVKANVLGPALSSGETTPEQLALFTDHGAATIAEQLESEGYAPEATRPMAESLAGHARARIADVVDFVADAVDSVDGEGDSLSDGLRQMAEQLSPEGAGGGYPPGGVVVPGGGGSGNPLNSSEDPEVKVYRARTPSFGHVADVIWLESQMYKLPKGYVHDRLSPVLRAAFEGMFRDPGGLLDKPEGPTAQELVGAFKSAVIGILEDVDPMQIPEVLVAIVALWGEEGDQGQRCMMRSVLRGLAPQHPGRGSDESWHQRAENFRDYDAAVEAFLDWLNGKGTDRKGLPGRRKSPAYKGASLALSMIGTPHELIDRTGV